MRRKLLTVAETAEALNVSVRYIRHLVFEGRVDVVRIGGLVRIPSDAVGELIGRGLSKARENPEERRPRSLR